MLLRATLLFGQDIDRLRDARREIAFGIFDDVFECIRL